VADDGVGLQVIDVSNPANPVWLGTYNTSGFAYGVAVAGTVAYVAEHRVGVEAIDVTNPSQPVRLGDMIPAGMRGNGGRWHSGLRGGLRWGLQILDLSDPSSPVRLGGFEASVGRPMA